MFMDATWYSQVVTGRYRSGFVPAQGSGSGRCGKTDREIAAQLGVSDQTIYNWRTQDQIDRGLRAGMSTIESAELAAARKRIRELEIDLAVTKRAHELLKAQ